MTTRVSGARHASASAGRPVTTPRMTSRWAGRGSTPWKLGRDALRTVVEGVRYGEHDGFDRVVLDIPGELPSYTVRYVTEVRRDPSDRPADVPGSAFLLIVLQPAQAHTMSGTDEINLDAIRSYAVVGDFEGHVSIALGLNGVRGYQVGELPGRIYVDIAA